MKYKNWNQHWPQIWDQPSITQQLQTVVIITSSRVFLQMLHCNKLENLIVFFVNCTFNCREGYGDSHFLLYFYNNKTALQKLAVPACQTFVITWNNLNSHAHRSCVFLRFLHTILSAQQTLKISPKADDASSISLTEGRAILAVSGHESCQAVQAENKIRQYSFLINSPSYIRIRITWQLLQLNGVGNRQKGRGDKQAISPSSIAIHPAKCLFPGQMNIETAHCVSSNKL